MDDAAANASPWERRSAARTAVVWEALQARLSSPGQCIVDIGGGTGGFAVRLAELGHTVTVIDPSPDALAAAGRRADERGVSDRVVGLQGDLTELGELVDAGSVDVVLCHEVLGLIDEPAAALDAIAQTLRPAGTLSLLVGQRHAAVIGAAASGQFSRARELLDGADGAIRLFEDAEARGLVARAGFVVDAVHAVRVFSGLVPAGLADTDAGAAAALLALERAVADREEYRPLAAQLHLLATRG